MNKIEYKPVKIKPEQVSLASLKDGAMGIDNEGNIWIRGICTLFCLSSVGKSHSSDSLIYPDSQTFMVYVTPLNEGDQVIITA